MNIFYLVSFARYMVVESFMSIMEDLVLYLRFACHDFRTSILAVWESPQLIELIKRQSTFFLLIHRQEKSSNDFWIAELCP